MNKDENKIAIKAQIYKISLRTTTFRQSTLDDGYIHSSMSSLGEMYVIWIVLIVLFEIFIAKM